MKRRSTLAFAAAAAAGLLAACSDSKPAFRGIDITGASYARQLALPDVNGKTRTLDEFKGKVVIVFFGYAQCPDVCPATLAEVADVRQKLGADGARVQPVFITVDPERDTAQVLKEYASAFGADVVALRADPEQTQAAAKEFKVYFAKVAGKTPGSYTIDHTAGAYIFDPQGRVRIFSRYGSGADALLQDVRQLLAGA